MKLQRQAKLLTLIRDNVVVTQEELSDLLREHGFDSTQATISRDIKELRLTKIPTDDGRYRYADRHDISSESLVSRLKTIFRESVTIAQAAQNIVVIKTLPALASAACSALDTMQELDIVGTIAGDDTAFVVMRDNESAEYLCGVIREMLE